MSVGDSHTEPVWLDGELARVGPYALGPRLGAGGAGTVYLATLEEGRPWGAAGTRVALKLLHPGRRMVPRALERLRREALVGMRVQHPAVVRTHEIGVHQHGVHELHYLVMEYVEGTTLSALIQGYGTVPEPLLRDLGLQIALGLQAIHGAGALHRDLKPTNVMITPDHHVKLMDLGLTHLLDEDVRLTASGMFLGTIEYAAPEQVEGDDPTTATDLYGLGVLLYEAATGRNPFAGGHHLAVLQRHLTLVPRRAGDLNPQLSPFLEELLATLLHKEPAQRLSSAGEVAELLERGESTPWWRRREAQLERGGEGLLPRRLRGEGDSAFVGREPELEQLRAHWRDARAGRGRALLLEGEGGVGKTRLLEELLRGLEIDREQVHLLYGAFAPGAVGVAAGALSQALLERYGAAALEGELVRRLPAMAPILPQVAAVITGSATALPQPLPLETLHSVFSQLAAALAEQRPTLWIVEDLHHTTVDNRSYFLALARMARERRMLIIGTAREGLPAGELEQLTRLEHARRVTLGRLSPEHVVRLVQREVASPTLAEELGARIAAKCDGNPYFALELVRELRARGQLTPTHPSTGFHSHSLEMPSTVRELLLARLADFGREERGVLDLAAVEGFEFDPDLLARVRQERRLRVLETLADIERRHRLVRATGLGFRFDHQLLQEALYETLAPALRREYHALLADAFAARLAEGRDGEATTPAGAAVFLARNYLRGGRVEAALPHLLPALDHLTRLYQHEAFLELASEGIAAMTDGELQATSHQNMTADVLLRQATVYELLGMRGDERRVAEAALAIAAPLGDEERALAARLRIAAGELVAGEFAKARPALEACLAEARAAGAARQEADALMQLGSVELITGNTAASREAYERLAEVARRLGDRLLEGKALARAAAGLLAAGEHQRATPGLSEALAVFRGTGARQEEAQATAMLGVAYRHGPDCRYDLARRHLEASLRTCREIGFRQGELLALSNHVLLDVELGMIDQAERRAAELHLLAQSLGARLFEAYSDTFSGECERARGRAAAALACFERALAQVRAQNVPRGIAETLLSIGRLHLEQGDRAQALAPLAEAASLVDLHQLDEPGSLPAAWLSLAGNRDPATVTVDRGPALLHAEAHLVLYLAGGDSRHLDAAAAGMTAIAAPLDEAEAATFWQHNPAARRLRAETAGGRGRGG